MTKRLRIGLFALIGMLSGCANNCGVIAGEDSFACNVILGGAFILSAPFTLPAEEAKRTAREAEEHEDYLKLKEGVKNGDLDSLKRCVLWCRNFLVFMDEKHHLRKEAELKLIALDEPALPQAYVEAMMVAYESLAWVKTPDSVPQLNSKHVMRGWALAQRFWQGPHTSSAYQGVPGELAHYVFVLYLQSLPASQIQNALEECVVKDNLPINPLKYQPYFSRSSLCESAYITYMKLQAPVSNAPQAPKELIARWRLDDQELYRVRLTKSLP